MFRKEIIISIEKCLESIFLKDTKIAIHGKVELAVHRRKWRVRIHVQSNKIGHGFVKIRAYIAQRSRIFIQSDKTQMMNKFVNEHNFTEVLRLSLVTVNAVLQVNCRSICVQLAVRAFGVKIERNVLDFLDKHLLVSKDIRIFDELDHMLASRFNHQFMMLRKLGKFEPIIDSFFINSISKKIRRDLVAEKVVRTIQNNVDIVVVLSVFSRIDRDVIQARILATARGTSIIEQLLLIVDALVDFGNTAVDIAVVERTNSHKDGGKGNQKDDDGADGLLDVRRVFLGNRVLAAHSKTSFHVVIQSLRTFYFTREKNTPFFSVRLIGTTFLQYYLPSI